MPKISIVSAYYNRKKQLRKTLKTVEKSSVKDFEFIIVDDGSDPANCIEDLAEEFSFVRLVRVDSGNKYTNPCISFNLGFSMVKGDIVIIQAPECLHLGDVLKYVTNNSIDNQYLVFSCYGLSDATSNGLDLIDFNLPIEDLKNSITNSIGEFRNANSIGSAEGGWVIHPVYRKKHLNFLTSMTTKDLLDLGGFDERFASGYAYDDTEFAERISKKNMDIRYIEKPLCIHQAHSKPIPNYSSAKAVRNRKLYEECLKSDNYRVVNSFLNKINK